MVRAQSPSGHAFAVCGAYWNALRIEVIETAGIHPEMGRRHPLAVKRINSADLAEKVAGGVRVELVFGETLCSGEQLEAAFVDLDHQRILAGADGAIARREFWKVGRYGKPHCAAMAGPDVTAYLASLEAGHATQKGLSLIFLSIFAAAFSAFLRRLNTL